MANITYRVNSDPAIPGTSIVKGTPLTNVEVDANFRAIDIEVDQLNSSTVRLTGNQTIGGTKTFTGKIHLTGDPAAVGTAGPTGILEIGDNSGITPATISFHRAGFAINMGLDTDDVFRLGGWSHGLNVHRWASDISGNFTAFGNITAGGQFIGNGLNLTRVAGSGEGVYNGNGDAASSTTANVQIRSWFGIGFSPSISGQPVPQNENAVWIDTRTGNLSARGNITAGGQFIGNGAVPPGAVMHFAMNSPPTGWLRANGAAVSRATFAALFAAIGTTYGAGDGSTTFNLPDLRGEFLRGWDDGRGVDTGRVIGSFQSDRFAAHDHDLWHHTGGTENKGTQISFAQIGGAGQGDEWRVTDAMSVEGSGTETRPRNVALLACIKF